jgi:hypothetical protein
VVDSGGLERLSRRLAIWHKIQPNPFGSRQMARFPLFLNSLTFCLFCAGFSDKLVTVGFSGSAAQSAIATIGSREFEFQS